MKLKMKHKISIVGMGYVGCGNALMLAKNNQVSIVDIDTKKVNDFNMGMLPISDTYAQNFLDQQELDISSTTELNESIKGSSFVILALPTNFDEGLMKYDTHILDAVAEQVLQNNHRATIIIRSTVDIGHTEYLKQKLNTQRIIFCPEFLREGYALEDSLHPSRIIIGGKDSASKKFSELMLAALDNTSIPILLMESSEAESVKLFANTYLAMRVAFFNELDNFAIEKNMNTGSIIQGVSLDARIGDYYNNPSFGYGGYCLPKDTKQLLSSYNDIPQSLIEATIQSNSKRKAFLLEKIIEMNVKTLGVYRLVMKVGSDNYRESAVLFLIDALQDSDFELIIYEPKMDQDSYKGIPLLKNLEDFISRSDMIVANRLSDELSPVHHKIFSRDLFTRDV